LKPQKPLDKGKRDNVAMANSLVVNSLVHDAQAKKLYSHFWMASDGIAIVGIPILVAALVLAFIPDSSGILLRIANILIACVIVIVIFAFVVRQHVRRQVRNVLQTDINLDTYVAFYQRQLEKVRLPYKRRWATTRLTLACACVDYLRGNYQQALAELAQADDNGSVLLETFLEDIQCYSLRFACAANLNDYTLMNNTYGYLSYLPAQTKAQRRIKDTTLKTFWGMSEIIAAQRPCDIFEGPESEKTTRLGHIEFTYNRACNAALKGDTARAKTLFSQIVGENHELFFVKNAQKYLAGNSDFLSRPFGGSGENPLLQPLTLAPYPPLRHSFHHSAGWAILGFFFPPVGLILFLVWHKRPGSQRGGTLAGIGAIIGALMYASLGILNANNPAPPTCPVNYSCEYQKSDDSGWTFTQTPLPDDGSAQ
jgi:hypothetical protein